MRQVTSLATYIQIRFQRVDNICRGWKFESGALPTTDAKFIQFGYNDTCAVLFFCS